MSRLGYKRVGGSQRHVGAILALALFAVIMIFTTSAGGALPTPALFELDGNATTANPAHPTPDDWDRIFCANNPSASKCSPSPGTPSAFSSNFVGSNVEGPSVDTTYFSTGQKDSFDIPSWTACGNSAPPKDELDDVFAAAYTDPATKDTILYFGADRDSTNGDSNIGFWFNQDPTFGLKGSCPGSSGFNGVHENGDTFVVSAFTNGGTQPTIDVYQWENAGTASAGLVLRSSGDAACAANGVGQNPACAIVNKSTIATPWPFGGTPGSVPTNGFFEGGVDLNALAPNVTTLPCFTSYLGETRSSQTLDATVKDFALGKHQQLRLDRAEEDMVRWRDRQHDSHDRFDGGRERCRAGHDRHEPQRRHNGSPRCRSGHVLREREHDPELHLEPRLREQQGRNEPERQRRSEQQPPADDR